MALKMLDKILGNKDSLQDSNAKDSANSINENLGVSSVKDSANANENLRASNAKDSANATKK